jgi:hypothetical protein
MMAAVRAQRLWQSQKAMGKCFTTVTLVASALPTIYGTGIAKAQGVTLAFFLKAGLRGW